MDRHGLPRLLAGDQSDQVIAVARGTKDDREPPPRTAEARIDGQTSAPGGFSNNVEPGSIDRRLKDLPIPRKYFNMVLCGLRV